MTTGSEMTQTMNQPFSIGRPVGERETNRSDDLEAVRNVLAEHGLCQRTVTGQRNAKFKPDLTAGIRIFQRQAGLDPDGLVIPGGPTAHALAHGGDAAGMSAPTEGKLADDAILQTIEQDIAEVRRDLRDASILPEGKQMASAATCASWQEQIARAERGIGAADRRIDAHNSLIQELENDLEDAKAKLRADLGIGAADSRIATHNRLIKKLENELGVAKAKLKELENARLDLEEVLAELRSNVSRRCPSA